ncbi:orotate phosphoribosyltransferase [Cysteiniphilum sp. QT6929]|uniref:orotate phosphoribosyltransferase n=1 Tax=Cysteiniphilum sp. QT6929 TaxID=2975055 RepID=UPI0024B3B19A|nr:orotate phosphoribosyltransferase [Cysteiniphilum sp. QT6929]WHN66267.1 orotate phosphoribosyltransferase [Cysteiniphilum sp. QT6929]
MNDYSFFDVAIEASALKFGEFTLKSGRISPYFFNAGLFNHGKTLHQLAECYAAKLIESKAQFDVLFGPAYKGISLAALVTSILYSRYGKDVGFCYNRKEKKDHGEGGVLVGADIKDKKVLIIDDVITAGTAIKEAIEIIKNHGGTIEGVCVALDRQEVAPNEEISAVQMVEKAYQFPVYAIGNLSDLIDYLKAQGQIEHELIERMKAYQLKYSVACVD